VEGTPTGVYALVARGALRCWFGADGPLKATHIFTAEAASPTQGGAAEIVLRERDPSLPDQRGGRAFRIAFSAIASGVRVGITNLKMADAIGGLMVQDADSWAHGGDGCQARTLGPVAETVAPRRRPEKTGFDSNPQR
jgi:hypothetical protein